MRGCVAAAEYDSASLCLRQPYSTESGVSEHCFLSCLCVCQVTWMSNIVAEHCCASVHITCSCSVTAGAAQHCGVLHGFFFSSRLPLEAHLTTLQCLASSVVAPCCAGPHPGPICPCPGSCWPAQASRAPQGPSRRKPAAACATGRPAVYFLMHTGARPCREAPSAWGRRQQSGLASRWCASEQAIF